MNVLHFLHGPLPKRVPSGAVALIADDLTEGVLNPHREMNQVLRSAHLGSPIRDLQMVQNAVASLGSREEVIVWNGPDHTDQLMLAWLVPLLRDLGLPASVLYLATPMNPRGQAVPVRGADRGEFTRGYMQRCPLGDHEVLLRRLWNAVTADNPEPLIGIQGDELAAFPYWADARDGMLARYPDATGLGFHDRVLLAQCDFRWRSAADVIDSVVAESEPLLPISRPSVWRRVLRLAQGESTALLLRCSGPLTPEDTELTLTELGYAASEGSADLLAHVQLCEWIGGTLVISPERLWRWTDSGLRRDLGDCPSQLASLKSPAFNWRDVLARKRQQFFERGRVLPGFWRREGGRSPEAG